MKIARFFAVIFACIGTIFLILLLLLTVIMTSCCDASREPAPEIDEVYDRVKNQDMKDILNASKDEHEVLREEMGRRLSEVGDNGKELNPIAKGMSYIKTNMKMMADPSDATVADLMTDGCHMGIKSLCRYLNQYAAADEGSKDLCRRLVKVEEDLAESLRVYL